MFANVGQLAMISIISHLMFIALTWWALQAINYEKFLRPNHVPQARVLFILVTIFIGSSVSKFFLDYLTLSKQLPYIFE